MEENKGPQTRILEELEDVVYDRNLAKRYPSLELYYMHRGVRREGDLRYDITIMPAQMLGEEFVKTKGHNHQKGMQELYTILMGEAIFLMQKTKNDVVEDVFAVKAKEGDWIMIPPHYAHITINPSEKELKMANWVSEECKSVYEGIAKMGGACYFYTRSGWIKNKNYKNIPEIRFEQPLKEKPEDLRFLKQHY